MRCLLIGSGGMTPLPERFLNVLLVQLGERGYLFDCGEGTQIAMKRWHAGFRQITLMAVTHLHGDHVLGIPGFLMARANAGAVDELTIVGPLGTRRFIEDVTADVDFVPPYPLRFIETDPARMTAAADSADMASATDSPNVAAANAAGRGRPREIFRDDRCRLEAAPLRHNVPCLGYRLVELDRPGRFHPDRARMLGVPEGPLWGRLQRGERVVLPAGEQVGPREVVGPPRSGRTCAMVTDTLPCPAAYRLLKGADIAFLEGMFLERDREAIEGRAHLTIRAAARMAARQGVRRAVLTHLSPRYRNDEIDELEAEARGEYPLAEMGRDGTWYEVPLPD